MAKNVENIRLYGGDSDSVWCAAKGSTGPTTLGSLDVAFKEVGWLSEDGIESSIDGAEVVKFAAHQGGATVRTKSKAGTYQFKFVCLETTALTLGLIHGQITWTITGLIARGVIGAGGPPEMAWVVDKYDAEASIHDREVYASGTPQLTGAVRAKHDEMTMLEFTVTASGKPDLITNAANIIAAV